MKTMTEKDALAIIQQWQHSERRFYLGATVSLTCCVLSLMLSPWMAFVATLFAFFAGANAGFLLGLKPSMEYLANGGKIAKSESEDE
jgi:hypothetical protein